VELTAEDPYVWNLAWLALTLAFLGYIDQARAGMDEALSEAHRLDHAYVMALVLSRVCAAEWVAGSPHKVKRHAKEVVALSNEHSFPHFLGLGLLHHGWSLTALGGAREGLALLTEGLSVLRATGAVVHTPLGLMWLAEAYAKVGQPDEGLNCLAEATQLIETTSERYYQAELHRLRGNLLDATGDRAAAEQSYHQALAIANRQSAKTFELHAATSLARLWRDQGKRTEARDLLAPIYNWFTEGFDTPVLKEAKALLDQLA
jgi:predicted ATPase